MKFMKHKSADASHYHEAAPNYDLLNEKNSEIINQTIEGILKNHKVKSVLDLTCGTGSQVFWLSKRGFEVVGSDVNVRMLAVAKQKAKHIKKSISFLKGDMRNSRVGQFDAVITIFNAVGHLTKKDFEKAMKNIWHNLKPNGFYIFDIFNLTYLLTDHRITQLTIDWQKKTKEKTIREIQYSTIDEKGILASYTIDSEQYENKRPKMKTHAQTLQIYTRSQLKNMLEKAGFKILSVTDVDGTSFSEKNTQRLLIVAKKQSPLQKK